MGPLSSVSLEGTGGTGYSSGRGGTSIIVTCDSSSVDWCRGVASTVGGSEVIFGDKDSRSYRRVWTTDF